VRSRGSAGVEYYSEWALSNPARKNTIPTPPAVFTASPASYYNTQVTLTWSDTAPGTSPIKNYVIQLSTSADGVNWGSWVLLSTVITSAASGSFAVSPSTVDGTRTRYRIAVTDALDVVSGYAVSNTIQRMSVPETPIVAAPSQGSTIYNTTPRFLIKTGGVPDGRIQRICVRIGAGAWQDSVENPERFSVSGLLQNGVATIFQSAPLQAGETTVTIRCVNDAGASAEVTRTFSVSLSLCEPIISKVTIVKAVHLQSLRDAVNHVRHFYGLSPAVWSESIIPHRTQIREWPLHIKEIRAALETVVAAVNSFDGAIMFDVPSIIWQFITTGSPTAAVMQQAIDLIMTL
jgi:hypothetical protein